VRGYYIDLRVKADVPRWPRPWVEPGNYYVAVCQWGLGAFERYLAGDGEEWLAAALDVGKDLLGQQLEGGPQDGGWAHRQPFPHTYRLEPPWLSAMAQGQGASLLARLYVETGDERLAEAAQRALAPFRIPSGAGGVRAELDGRPFPEEYPTSPPSFVLNGAIFALWGLHDVAVALGDRSARQAFNDGVETLAANLHRWDAGYWSRYDLYPHPVLNVASSSYHVLHVSQLRALHTIAPHPVFSETADRFERYAASATNRARAFVRKGLFRVCVPRNRLLAHRLPWSARRSGG
jgi:hypothetical protein